jgi:hypothetical protein
MNRKAELEQAQAEADGTSPAASRTETERQQRRRLLVKGLGKGSALLAAAVPLESLATGTVLTGNGMLCTVSGNQSAVRSKTAGVPTCGGYQNSKYCNVKTFWPGYDSVSGHASFACNGKTVTSRAACTFNYVFGGGSTGSFWAVVNGTAGTANERIWATALLNAQKCLTAGFSSMNYPYTPAQVMAHYTAGSTAALSFYSTHMQNMP